QHDGGRARSIDRASTAHGRVAGHFRPAAVVDRGQALAATCRDHFVRSCTSCGAASPLVGTWCTQCFAPFAGLVPATVPAIPAIPAIPTYAEPAGRMVSRRAFLLTIVAVGVGALAMLASYGLSRTQLDEATYIRYAAVLTMAVYAVV